VNWADLSLSSTKQLQTPIQDQIQANIERKHESKTADAIIINHSLHSQYGLLCIGVLNRNKSAGVIMGVIARFVV
jgi:hypothetical protein